MTDKTFVCDPKTGLCHPIEAEVAIHRPIEKEEGKELIYVGDPMCSWCYGISNHLRQLKVHLSNYQFTIVVGGLRPGGGGAWDEATKAMIQHHWEEVNKCSELPFGDQLFQLEDFNYDTEPACRAIVTARKWMGEYELDFYEEVTRKFYVENKDPKEIDFYKSICERFAIPFEEFVATFNSEDIKYETYSEFQLNRNWGVRGYPAVLLRIDKQLHAVSLGYSDFETMKVTVERILNSVGVVDEQM